jgi:hypothetical protein
MHIATGCQDLIKAVELGYELADDAMKELCR